VPWQNGINAVLGRVQNAIARRGFVTTRVLAGAQQLQSGTLVLTLVPGRVVTLVSAMAVPPFAII